jgi:hypothetical protein
MVDGEHTCPITLTVENPLSLDVATPAAQSLPPIRATLEERLAKWQQPSDLGDLPWELQEAGRWVGQNVVEELREYLSHDLPPRALAWTLHTPDDLPNRFLVTLSAGDAKPVMARVVVGDLFPPEREEDLGDGKGPVQVVRPHDPNSPIRFVRLAYSTPKSEGSAKFWAPLAAVGWSRWEAGWLLRLP